MAFNLTIDTTAPSAPTATADIVLSKSSLLGVAPSATFFEVENFSGFDTVGPVGAEVYDARMHDLYYYWDFDDAGTFTSAANLVAEHKNSGIAYGPMVSHTFRAAGTYTVSVLIMEPATGKFATETLDVVVGDDDALFSTTKTHFVDTAGNYTGKPAGALEYTTLEAAWTAVAAASETVPQRIILRQGQTFSLTNRHTMGSTFPSLHIVASDDGGARPVIDCDPNSDSLFIYQDDYGLNTAKEFTMSGIEMDGVQDVIAGTGMDDNRLFVFQNAPADCFLLDNCYIHNFYGGVQPDVVVPFKVINDTVMTDYQSTAMLDRYLEVTCFTGCRLATDPLTPMDAGSGNAAISNYRSARADKVIFDATDCFSSIGWSTAAGYNWQQPNTRFNTSGYEDAKASYQRCSFESGGYIVELLANESNDVGRVGNIIIEKCLLVGSWQTTQCFRIGHSGLTIRNNLIIRPDAPSPSSTYDPDENGAVFHLEADPDGVDAAGLAGPIRIYNNTFVSLMSAANYQATEAAMPMLLNNSGFTDVVEANNINHQPNLTTPIDGDGPLDATVLWSPRYLGYVIVGTPLDASLATPTDTIATYAPLTGSAAIGDAVSGDVAYDDFYGNVRGETPSRGAFEPAL